MTRAPIPLILALVVGCAPAHEGAQDRAALLAAHAQILASHRTDDLVRWMALEADEVLVGNRGKLTRIGRAEREAGRRAYLAETEFTVYRDLQDPVVTVSRDGTLGWVVAQVELQGTQTSDGLAAPIHDVWAWIEMYERQPEGWKLVGNLSNVKPAE